MSNIVLPSTELEAVNAMLESILEAPVITLVGEIPLEAVNARLLLSRTSLAVQMKGWSFNMDEEYSLLPDRDGFIFRPQSAIRIDPSHDHDIIERTGKLYHRKNQTYTFTEPVLVDVVWFYEYDDLPEHAKHYIYTVAARRFQETKLSDTTLRAFDAEAERMSRLTFEEVEADRADYNIFKDSASVAGPSRLRYRR